MIEIILIGGILHVFGVLLKGETNQGNIGLLLFLVFALVVQLLTR